MQNAFRDGAGRWWSSRFHDLVAAGGGNFVDRIRNYFSKLLKRFSRPPTQVEYIHAMLGNVLDVQRAGLQHARRAGSMIDIRNQILLQRGGPRNEYEKRLVTLGDMIARGAKASGLSALAPSMEDAIVADMKKEGFIPKRDTAAADRGNEFSEEQVN